MDLELFDMGQKTKMLKEAFNSFKMSSDAKITRENLTSAFTKYGVEVSEDELDIYFKENPDGIDYATFQLLILN